MQSILKIFTILMFVFVIVPQQILAQSNDAINTLDSLLEVAKKEKNLDSLYFVTYRRALEAIPNTLALRRITYSEKGINLAQKVKQPNTEAMMVFSLSQFYGSIDSIATALRLAEYAQNITEDLDRKRILSGWTAIYASISNNYPKAIQYYLEEIDLCDQLNAPEMKDAPYSNLTELFLEIGDNKGAKKYARKSFDIDDSPKSRSYASTLLGRVHQREGNLDSAQYYYEKGLSYINTWGPVTDRENFIYSRNHTYYHLSRFFRETGNSKLGLIYADSSMKDIQLIENLSFEYTIYGYSNLAMCYLNLGRFAEAEEAISHIENKVVKGDISYALFKVYSEYKIAYALSQNDYKTAYKYSSDLQEKREETISIRNQSLNFSENLSPHSSLSLEESNAVKELQGKWILMRNLAILFAVLFVITLFAGFLRRRS